MSTSITTVDWVIIGIYFIVCLFVGVFTKLRQKKNTAEEYFLAGRSMKWFAVGTSLYASNMGSEHFIGLAGAGASTGIAVVAYEWHASWVLLLLGFFFVPIYLRSGIYTMPEYLKRRFQSKWMRVYLTVVSLVSYITTKIAVDIYAGGLFLKEAVGLNIYFSSFILLSFTALYTLLGGLTAVIYTDLIQCLFMVVGAISLSAIGFSKVGGFRSLWNDYPLAVGNSSLLEPNVSTTIIKTDTFSHEFANYSQNFTNIIQTTCYNVEENWSHIFRPIDDSEFPWIGVVFSLPITGIWYWCTDQVIVQRTLGAKNLLHARAGTIFAGFLKILPLFIMIMPGMIARVLFPDVIACPDYDSCFEKCGNGLGCSNLAYPQLVLNILPKGLVGLMLSVMVAAVMSSLSSAFNSASTIFTMDIWKVFRSSARDRELLWVGRVIVIVLACVGIAWIPVVQSGGKGQLFAYLQSIQSYLAPPTCAVFLVGMLWPRLTETGALTTMMFGLVLGIVRITLDVAYAAPSCGEADTRPLFLRLHFMYYALIMFVVCIFLMCGISLFTKPVPIEMLGRLTWTTIDRTNCVSDDKENDSIPMDQIPFKSPVKGIDQNEASVTEICVKVEDFETQSKLQGSLVWCSAFVLIILLLVLWVYFG